MSHLYQYGGTYTMTYKEAAELVNEIKPKIAVPIHYGSVVGTKKDPAKFIELLKPEIQGKILMKQKGKKCKKNWKKYTQNVKKN